MTGKKPYAKPAVRRLGNIDDVQNSSEEPELKQAAEELDEQSEPKNGARQKS